MMNRVTTDQTINVTKDLSILYAEDDMQLQEQIKDFFELLFKHVVTVNNGADALTKYKEEKFDIVISDVKMPLLNGMELSQHIRDINPIQPIIIVSAYNDLEYLIQFINLNIRQFIQKPINIDDMLETLYLTSKAIVNETMIVNYRQELESNNLELIKKNNELKNVKTILDMKIVQPLSTHEDITRAIIEKKDLQSLKEIEITISSASMLLSMKKNINQENIQRLGTLISSYAAIVQKYVAYSNLSQYFEKLGKLINAEPSKFMAKTTVILTSLKSLIYVLHKWRDYIDSESIQDAFNLQTSMIADMSNINFILTGETFDK